MQSTEQEKRLLLVAVGVPVFTILAFLTFFLGLSVWLFYIFAILAIALGFYLAFSLSKEKTEPDEQQGKKKK